MLAETGNLKKRPPHPPPISVTVKVTPPRAKSSSFDGSALADRQRNDRKWLRFYIVLAQMAAFSLLVCMFLWVSNNNNPDDQAGLPAFNYHPLSMTIGFVFLGGQGMLCKYRKVNNRAPWGCSIKSTFSLPWGSVIGRRLNT